MKIYESQRYCVSKNNSTQKLLLMKYTLKEKKEYKTEIYNKYFADILKALDDVFHMKL